MIVVDASVLIAAFLPDEESPIPFVEMLHQGVRFLAPAIMPTEFANTLLVAKRRGRLSGADLQEIADVLGTMPIEIDGTTPERSLRGILWLAEATDLTTYDACYLELALRTGAELATIDRQLRAIAESKGVRCLPL